MLKRVWVDTKSTATWKARVELHEYRDGSEHYCFIDRHGRGDETEKGEAERIIKQWGMTEETERFVEAGWIAR